MRYLVTAATNNGEPRAFLVSGDDDLDVVNVMGVLPTGEAGDEINEGSTVMISELPDGDFRPAVFDSEGDEVSMEFIEI